MSQLRNHLKFTWKNRWRSIRERRSTVYLGKNAFIDKNVELIRFPENIFIKDNVVITEGACVCSNNKGATVNSDINDYNKKWGRTYAKQIGYSK